jgi:hypothetical protein
MKNNWEIGEIYTRLKSLEEQMDRHEKEVTHDFDFKISELETKIEILKSEKDQIQEIKVITTLLLCGSLFLNAFLFFKPVCNDLKLIYA